MTNTPDDLERERDYFRDQCDDLGGRVLRLQEEQSRAQRDARRWRTIARITSEAYRAGGPGIPLSAVSSGILTAILDNLICDRAAFLHTHNGEDFIVEQALGFGAEPLPRTSRIAAPPRFACVSSQSPPTPDLEPLLKIVNLPYLLWSFDSGSGFGLIIGSRSEGNVARAFDRSDEPIIAGALNVFLDLREKDRLRQERGVLTEELKHRVHNSLQVVYGMLGNELSKKDEPVTRDAIQKIARRVLTMALVYDHLLGGGMSRAVDFATYLKALSSSLAQIESDRPLEISLICDLEQVFVTLDTVTAIGLVVAELVANSYEHAFPEGRGTIRISLRQRDDSELAILTISDDGKGFVPAESNKRRGLGLVRRLATQAHATIEWQQGEAGSTWKLLVPTCSPAVRG